MVLGVAGVILSLVALFVPVWTFTAQVPTEDGSESFELITYLTGQYSFSSSANTNKTTCPLAGGNYSKCDSLNATARLYEAMEVLVIGGAFLGVAGLVLAVRAKPTNQNRPASLRMGWVTALVGSLLIVAAAIGIAAGQPGAFSADSPPGANSPFGELPSWCPHGPDSTFWAGCNSGPTEFIKWQPGVGWFFLVVGGVVVLTSAILAWKFLPPGETLTPD
jgi:hypothetical protein